MLEWEWRASPETGWLYITLLAQASFRTTIWQGREIKPGQLVTSYAKLSEQTGISVQSIRTALKRLKSTGYLTCEATNKYTIISLLKYEEIQGLYGDTNKQTNTETSNQVTGEQQTTNNIVTIRQNKQGEKVACAPRTRFTPPTVEEVAAYCKERRNHVDAQRFVDYYESNGWKVGKNPMKSWQAAVRRWARRDIQDVKGGTNDPYQGFDAI